MLLNFFVRNLRIFALSLGVGKNGLKGLPGKNTTAITKIRKLWTYKVL
jgi:hypothetical protein